MGASLRFWTSFCILAWSFVVHAASTELFFDNATHTPILEFIQSARTSIDIEIYEIQDIRVQQAVLTAMDRGVKVRVIQEPESVGSNCCF